MDGAVAESGGAEAALAERLPAMNVRAVAGLVMLLVAAGLLTVFFSSAPVHDYGDAQAADRDAFARFHGAMLERGVYLPPSPFEAWFPSLAHGEDEVEATLAAAGEAFEAVAS